MSNEEESNSKIESKLDTIIRLLALSVASDNHSLKDRAIRLTRAGMTPKEIADLCDTTPNTVSVALYDAKKTGKKNKRLKK